MSSEDDINEIMSKYKKLMKVDDYHFKDFEKELETLNRMAVRSRIFTDKIHRDRKGKIKDILNG